VLRTFPKWVWRSAQNLVDLGPAVRAGKRDIGKYINTTKSLLYRETSQPGPGAAREIN